MRRDSEGRLANFCCHRQGIFSSKEILKIQEELSVGIMHHIRYWGRGEK
jgi:hypothetical protein